MLLHAVTILCNRRFPLCDCSNGDCCGVGMEWAAVNCGGSGRHCLPHSSNNGYRKQIALIQGERVLLHAVTILCNRRFSLCNRCNGDCHGVGMERAAVDCGGSGSLWNGIACITHRTMDIEKASTHSKANGCSCMQ